MTAHLILRLVIYGLGFHAACSGVSQLAYYTHLGFTTSDWSPIAGSMFGFVIVPLMFALLAFGSARALATSLLGPEGQPVLTLHSAEPDATLRLALQILGVCVFATTIGYAISTVYEFVAVRAGTKNRLDEAQIQADAIANATHLAVAYMLTLQTGRVVRWIRRNEDRR